MPLKNFNPTLILYTNLLLAGFTSLILASCAKNNTAAKNNTCQNTCPAYGACTDVFISSILKIQNSDGSPYILDSFKTTRSEDSKVLDPTKQYTEPGSAANGVYPVFNDNFISLTNQCGKEFYFSGYKDGVEVVKEKYVFSHDCCHMQRISGAKELTK